MEGFDEIIFQLIILPQSKLFPNQHDSLYKNANKSRHHKILFNLICVKTLTRAGHHAKNIRTFFFQHLNLCRLINFYFFIARQYTQNYIVSSFFIMYIKKGKRNRVSLTPSEKSPFVQIKKCFPFSHLFRQDLLRCLNEIVSSFLTKLY